GENQQPVAGLFPIAQQSKFASGYRGTMTTHRTSGPQAHGTKSALTQQLETTLPLYQEILRGLPVGIVVLHLENPRDVKSFRITDVNPAGALLTGATLEDLRGRTLAEFPKLLKTRLPLRCLDAFQSREPRNLGEISYGDERIREGIYAVQVFPLLDNFIGVAFENVTERRQAEQSLHQSEERFRLLVQSVQEYAIINLDPAGNVVSWNKVVVTALRNDKGSLQGFAKITRDMTERHGKEESLAKAKDLLELRVEQRTTVLARVNHELRTEIAERVRAEEQLRASLDQLR